MLSLHSPDDFFSVSDSSCVLFEMKSNKTVYRSLHIFFDLIF